MKRTTAFILAVLLLLLPVISYTEQTIYQKEENIGRDKDSYPYTCAVMSRICRRSSIRRNGGHSVAG